MAVCLCPSCSQLRLLRLPVRAISSPFRRLRAAYSAALFQAQQGIKSATRSLPCSGGLFMAMVNVATAIPLGVRLSSGSLVRFPTRHTWFIGFLFLRDGWQGTLYHPSVFSHIAQLGVSRRYEQRFAFVVDSATLFADVNPVLSKAGERHCVLILPGGCECHRSTPRLRWTLPGPRLRLSVAEVYPANFPGE